MTQKYIPLVVLLLVPALILACGSSAPAATPDLATVVAQTLQALTPAATPASGEAESPASSTDLLPHSLYYMNKDGAGFYQVFRLEPDGKTTQQLTFEPANVDSYDISPLDGSLVYVSNNQLLLVTADGSGRRILVDGGTLSTDESYIKQRIGSARWSKDGNTISFGMGGLNFYSLSTGTYSTALTNQFDTIANQADAQNSFTILREAYSPLAYSPDGSKLLINIGYYEGGTIGVYIPSSNTLIRPSANGIVCCTTRWTPDSNSVYIASPSIGMIEAGLWKMDAATGTMTTLLYSNLDATNFDFAESPFIGPDGQLYFFFANLSEIPQGHTPLTMVRAAPDGVTGRIPLHPDTFTALNEALWAPDASFAIVIQSADGSSWQEGQALLVYTDGRPAVNLLPQAQYLNWGP